MTTAEVTTLVDMLVRQSLRQGDKTAFYFIDPTAGVRQSLSYSELDKAARAIAANLVSQGYSVGSRVILIYPPGLDLIKAFFGCLYAGLVAVPVYPPTNTKLVDKLQKVVMNAEPCAILSTKMIINQLRQLKRVKWLHQLPVLNSLTERFFPKAVALSDWDMGLISLISTDTIDLHMANHWVKPLIDRESLAFFQYTSGSTGVPKGVMLRHGNLLHNMELTRQSYDFRPADTFVSWLPPYHDFGLIGLILEPLYLGISAYHMSPFDFLKNPALWLQTISDIGGAVASGAPNFAYDYCVKKIPLAQRDRFDLSRWELALNGAEPVRASTLRSFTEAFAPSGFSPRAFVPAYGMAETCLFISCSKRGAGAHIVDWKHTDASGRESHRELVSCGMPPDEVVIVSPEDGHRCVANEVGELCHYSASIAAGYWRQQEETARAFQYTIEGDDRHFLRTGDLGFLDEHGELFITGRLKDLVIIRGINYYPQDIEYEVSHAHVLLRPDQCVAFSISNVDIEQLAVVCETDSVDVSVDGPVLIEVIRDAIIASFGISVHTIALIKPRTLLKTTSGKVRRKDTRAALLSNDLALIFLWEDNASFIEPSIVPPGLWMADLRAAAETERPAVLIHHLQVLLSTVLNQVEPDRIDVHKSFFELGLDSLMIVEFCSHLQRQFGFDKQLSSTIFFDYPNLFALSEHLAETYFSNTILMGPSETNYLLDNISKTLPQLTFHEKEYYDLLYTQEYGLKFNSIKNDISRFNMSIKTRLTKINSVRDLISKINDYIENNDTLSIQFSNHHDGFNMSYKKIKHPEQLIQVIKTSPMITQDIINSALLTPFNLLNDYLFRFIIILCPDGHYDVIFIANHLITDIYSLYSLKKQLQNGIETQPKLLQAKFNEQQRILYPPIVPDNILNYWSDQLNGLNPLKLHQSQEKKIEVMGNSQMQLCHKNDLMTLSSVYKSTGFNILLALSSLIFNALTHNQKIQFIVPVSSRELDSSRTAHGLFIKNQLLIAEINWNQSFELFNQSIRDNLQNSIENYYSFDLLLETLVKKYPSLAVANLPIVIGYMGDQTDDVEPGTLNNTDLGVELFIYFGIDSNGFYNMYISYKKSLFEEEFIQKLFDSFKSMLHSLSENHQKMNYQLISNIKLNGISIQQRKKMIIHSNFPMDTIANILGYVIDDMEIVVHEKPDASIEDLFKLGDLGLNTSHIILINLNQLSNINQLKEYDLLKKIEDFMAIKPLNYFVAFIYSLEKNMSDMVNKIDSENVSLFDLNHEKNKDDLYQVELARDIARKLKL